MWLLKTGGCVGHDRISKRAHLLLESSYRSRRRSEDEEKKYSFPSWRSTPLRRCSWTLPPDFRNAPGGNCAPRKRAQIWAAPPSTNSSVPVTKVLSSEARKTAALAISSGVPKRPIGTLFTILANICWPAGPDCASRS